MSQATARKANRLTLHTGLKIEELWFNVAESLPKACQGKKVELYTQSSKER